MIARASPGRRGQDDADLRVADRRLPRSLPCRPGRHRDGVAQDQRRSSPRRAPFDAARRLAQLRQLRHGVHRRQDAARPSSTRRSSWSSRSSAPSSSASMAAYAIDRFEFRLQRLVIGLFLLATLVPGRHHPGRHVPGRQRPRAVQHPLVGDRAVPRHRHRVDLHLPAVHARRSRGRWTRPRAHRGREPASPSTGAIILPLLKPAIATVVIIKGIAIYNEFYIPFLYMPSQDLGVISTSLFRFKGPFGAQWEIISAGVILVIIPTLIAVPRPATVHLQRLHRGAVK